MRKRHAHAPLRVPHPYALFMNGVESAGGEASADHSGEGKKAQLALWAVHVNTFLGNTAATARQVAHEHPAHQK